MQAVARTASLLRRTATGPVPATPHHSQPGAGPSVAKVRSAPLLSSLSHPFPLYCPRCGGAPLPSYRWRCCCYPRRQRISSLRVGAASVGFTSGLGARVVQLLRWRSDAWFVPSKMRNGPACFGLELGSEFLLFESWFGFGLEIW
jgi:hypothetical protein